MLREPVLSTLGKICNMQEFKRYEHDKLHVQISKQKTTQKLKTSKTVPLLIEHLLSRIQTHQLGSYRYSQLQWRHLPHEQPCQTQIPLAADQILF